MIWRSKVYPTDADVGKLRRSLIFAWWPRRCHDGQTRWLEPVTRVEGCYLRTPLIDGFSWAMLQTMRYPHWGVVGYESPSDTSSAATSSGYPWIRTTIGGPSHG